MKQPLYTTSFLSEFFGVPVEKIHRICYDNNIVAHSKEERQGTPIAKNFYTEFQKNRIERILKEKAIKEHGRDRICEIETVYYIVESKINTSDLIK